MLCDVRGNRKYSQLCFGRNKFEISIVYTRIDKTLEFLRGELALRIFFF